MAGALLQKPSVCLIGMPGAGKSSLGVLLAKALGLAFMDTDLLIQESEGKLLQAIVENKGFEGFISTEERALISIKPSVRAVIATGGSAVYSKAATLHLRGFSTLVYLQLPLESLEGRLKNIATRGVLFRPGQGLKELFAERLPLYEAAADLIVPCEGLDVEAALLAVIAALRGQKRG
ncbi:MAG: shikimate kinase [Christensenellaceae bacterium]|jgi:shikimate kinase|nr:shikimate kinase [Christensenellaceae bacterium]